MPSWNSSRMYLMLCRCVGIYVRLIVYFSFLIVSVKQTLW